MAELDLAQFHDTFFEESFEALDSMEAALLKLDVGAPNPEGVNTIFRVAHSIKGGAGMFGFTDVASFTHTLETLLDELRSARMQVTTYIADQLLRSVDVLRAMMRSVQRKEPVDMQRVADLQFDLEAIVASKGGSAPVAAPRPVGAAPGVNPAVVGVVAGAEPVGARASAPTATVTSGGWEIGFRALPELLVRGNDPLAIFSSLAELGPLQVTVNLDALPRLRQIDAERCYLTWTLQLTSDCSQEQIDVAFDWAVGDCEVTVRRREPQVVEAGHLQASGGVAAGAAYVGEGGAAHGAAGGGQAAAVHAAATPSAMPGVGAAAACAGAGTPRAGLAASTMGVGTPGAGALASPTGAGAHVAGAPASVPGTAGAAAPTAAPASTVAAGAARPSAPTQGSEAPKAPGTEHSSIRVSIEKIDELINTVGELVITQAMLSEVGRKLEGPFAEQFRSGLSQLERNMRELQESVMRVRMLPISFTFSRFPRMVRDLAQRLGKQIELKLTGEHTELDKTVLEKIGDPLVHLVRNSVDHGIESPQARIAAGKSPVGTVHLDACHRGGSIAVEIRDDGGGLDKNRILAKARSRGLVGANDVLTDDQIHELIFLPGFSTAEKTTDVSGRGVGMDVVRRNVKELGGKIEIASELGKGSRFIITLPLTLAIVDGQSVSVGTETYIVPLTSIIESLQLQSHSVSRLSGRGEVFSFRGDYLPIVRLHEVFGVKPRACALHEGLIVVAEGDGRRIGLFVDELLGQQQVVIKSMETNYGPIDGVAGATILGDGSVALILDLSGLIRVASRRAAA
jgi:two-component system chemotaxis sensor kinase CheA